MYGLVQPLGSETSLAARSHAFLELCMLPSLQRQLLTNKSTKKVAGSDQQVFFSFLAIL